MAKLADMAENALNETRMLILGAQVLIGFGFQAAFQPGFDRLPAEAQQLKLLGLGLMLIALALLIAPCAFHQIVECGNDSPRLIVFTGRIAAFALLPFAVTIGIELFLAALVVFGAAVALPVGVIGLIFALFLWYGLEWLWREPDRHKADENKERTMKNEGTSLENKIKQVLTEARVVLPGAQALLGFQLAAILTDGFAKLPRSSQYAHIVSLGLIAVTIVLLMAPAAFHRIVERGEDTERLHRFASAVLAAMVPLALGVASDFYVVVSKVLDAPALAAGLAGASLVVFFGLWFGLTLALRTRDHASRSALRVSRAAR